MSKKALKLGIKLIHEVSGNMLEMIDEEEMEELEQEELEADELYGVNDFDDEPIGPVQPIEGEISPAFKEELADAFLGKIEAPIPIKGKLWPTAEIPVKKKAKFLPGVLSWTNK